MESFPLELEYRLTFGDRVLSFAPGPTWHPVVTTIFRLAFAGSGVSLIATYLTIVVRQRRRRFYAVTRDHVLLGDDFWSGGFRAVPLERITDATVDAAPCGEGTITLVVDDGTRPRLAHVAGARAVHTILMEACADWQARRPVSVPLEIFDTLEPGERVLWWGRPKQGSDVFGHDGTRGLLVIGPIAIATSWAMAGAQSGVRPKVIAAMLSVLVLGLGIAVASIDARLRFNTFYAITDRRVLVLGWKWRHGRRTFRLALTDLRYVPSVSVTATGAGTIRFTADGGTSLYGWRLADEPTATFDRIADVRAVHAIVVAAAEAATRRVSRAGATR